ncbi:hypothetical protein ACFLX4_00285 [Chloroflexota bacterium]
MTNDNVTRIDIGSCSNCRRTLRVKLRGLRENMRLTCKCGHINTFVINEETLSQYGIIRVSVKENFYENSNVPLYRLLDGPCLKAAWAEAEAQYAERFKDLPREYWTGLSDIISVSINPYLSEQTARDAMRVLVERVKAMDKARPWSIELFENAECSIMGLLDAPFFIFLGMTEIKGCTSQENYEAFKQIVDGLRSDHPRTGAEWEIYSQGQGNQWRSDRCARLVERWVFLDADIIQTFPTQRD